MENEEKQEGNSISDIRRYFEDGDHPLKPNEFTEFWKSLSEWDKQTFKEADLSS